MTILSGGRIVLPDRILPGGSLVIEDGRIAAIEDRAIVPAGGADVVAVAGCSVVPGFIDVHVHGVDGTDVLDNAAAVAEVAARLPKYGVTAFCPTSVACAPDTLADVPRRGRPRPGLAAARVRARAARAPREQLHQSGLERRSTRALPSHLRRPLARHRRV